MKIKFIFCLLLISFGLTSYAQHKIHISTQHPQLKRKLGKVLNQIDQEKYNSTTKFIKRSRHLLNKLLRSNAYYSATVSHKINTDGFISFDIKEGSEYIINNILIKFIGNSEVNLPQDLPLKKMDIADSSDVLKTQSYILNKFIKENCLSDVVIKNEVKINHEEKNIDIVFILSGAEGKKINDIKFIPESMQDELSKIINIKDHCFKTSTIQNAKNKLRKMNIFDSISVKVVQDMDKVNILFNLKKRKTKTAKFGVSYDSGLGANLSWENRNIAMSIAKLKSELILKSYEQMAIIEYSQPLYRNHQSVNIKANFKRNNILKLIGEVELEAGLEREFLEKWTASAGGRFSYINEEDKNYKILSVPLEVNYDNRDGHHLGHAFKANLTPSNEIDEQLNFLKYQMSFIKYIPINNKLNFAFHVKFGTISNTNIPDAEKFLLNIRGHEPYRSQSFLNNSFEARINISKHLILTGFFDSVMSSSDIRLNQGTGLGLSYKIGDLPFGMEIGFPLDNMSTDSAKLYIRTGYSF